MVTELALHREGLALVQDLRQLLLAQADEGLLYLLSYRGVWRKRCADAIWKKENGDPERTRTVDLQRDRLAC